VDLSTVVASLSPDRPLMVVEDLEVVTVTASIFVLETLAVGEFIEVDEFACHSAACRPPTSGGTGGSVGRGGVDRIPSRLPKGGGDSDTSLGIQHLSPDNIQAQIDRLHAVGAVPKEYKTTEEVLGFMEKNIQSVLDEVSMEDRAAWKEWYVAANRLGADMAATTNISHSGANAVIAALSPGTGWDQNVAMARSAVKTLHEDAPITSEVAARANALRQESWARELVAHEKKHEKAVGERAKLQQKLDAATDPRERKEIEKAIAKKDEIIGRPAPEQPDLNMFKAGQRPSEGDDLAAAYIIRASDPNPKLLQIKVNPDGSYDDSQVVLTKSGGEAQGTWQSYSNIAKAVRIYRDPSPEVISEAMGDAHKIRTFFNNINNPFDPRNEGTIDTHSAGISLGVPLSINHPWIASGGKSIMSAPSHVADGTKGTYSLMAEAHRRVAERNGLLPRELQSITWEQWRRKHDRTSRGKLSTAAKKEMA
jgi:hypothetical protein